MTLTTTYDPALSRVRVTTNGGVLSNAGFEVDLEGWSAQGGALTRVNTQAHSGAWSALLTPNGVASIALGQMGSFADFPLVTAGKTYRASMWLRAPNPLAQVSIVITWWDAAGVPMTTSAGSTVALSANVWTQFVAVLTAPVGAARAQLRARIHGTPPVTDTMFIDDAQVLETWAELVDRVDVERSVNGVTWTPVRGGQDLPLTFGVSVTVDDYEFPDGAPVEYRATYRDSSATSFVSNGAGDSQNNASVAPGLPPGTSIGDMVLIFASIRNSGAGTPNTPAGWTLVCNMTNARIFGRIYDGVWTMPTVSFAGGVANADTLAQACAFRGPTHQGASLAGLLNASAQNIAYPALTVPSDNMLIVVAGWKQDDFTSVATLAGMVEINERTTTTGDDASQVWDYVAQTTKANIGAGSFVVTGGASAISRGAVIAFPRAPYTTRETSTITPTLDTVWLKTIAKPFLNRPVTVVDFSSVQRSARNGIFPVVNRTYAVAVTDVRTGRQFELTLMTPSLEAADELDTILAGGEPVFLHTPAGCPVPGPLYAVVGDITQERRSTRGARRYFSLPLTEVAAPGTDVVGATVTCQGVLNVYTTCQAVLDAHPTCADLLELIGSPSDVVVP